MGLSGINKSQVSKLCKDIDERVNAFLDRSLSGEWPYLWLDATYLKQREGGRIVSVAAIIAVAVDTEGRREIVGLHIGPSEAETFWTTFLKSLVRRGLRGVKLVISDAHEGLKGAIRRVMGATWQRCEECAGLRAQGAANDGGRRAPAGVLATRPGQRPQGLAHHGRPVPGSLAQARQAARRERARCVGLSLLPGPAPGQVAQYELAGAPQQGSEAPRRCGRHLSVRAVHLTTDRRRAVGGQRRMAAAAPLHADRGHGRANVANRDRGRDYSRRAHPSDTPGRITDGHLSPKPIPTILSDATCPLA